MFSELSQENVVIVAKRFNPSIVDKHWLIKNKLVDEDDITGQNLSASVVSQIITDNFSLIVFPEQLQFTLMKQCSTGAKLVKNIVGGIVEKLPETPYTAIGLNFVWHVYPEDFGIANLVKSLFHIPGRPLYDCFDSEDARFGAYMSRNIHGFRLKLDIKPTMIIKEDNNKLEVLTFAFNYHLDISACDEGVASIHKALANWEDAKATAEETVKIALEICGDTK